MSIVQKQYNSISSYYEIFYSGIDKEVIYKTFIDAHKKYFDELTANSIVSDCSCGNGLQAIAMKKNGINVIATDISEEMICLARENAKEEGLEFPILNIGWQEMPKNYTNYFDLVFCWGNSISHSLSKEEMMINLKAIHTTMKNNSKLIIETRNWDKIIQEKQRYYSYEEKIYNGKRVLPIYVMNVEGFDKESYLEMLFIEIDDDKKTKCNGFKLNFTPFSHEEFIKRLKESGFKVVEDSYDENNDFYSVVVEK